MAEDINCLLGKCKNLDHENRMMEEAKKMARREENSMESKSSKGEYDPNDKKGVNKAKIKNKYKIEKMYKNPNILSNYSIKFKS